MSEGNAQAEPTNLASEQTHVRVDKEQQERIAQYLSTRRRIFRVLNGIVAIFFIFCVIPTTYGIIAGIAGNPVFAAQPLVGWYPLRAAIIYLYAAGVLSTLFLPFSFINGFLLPNIYKIRPRKFLVWLIVLIVGIIVRVFRWLVFLELCYWLLIVQPNNWWIWITVLLALIGLGKAYILPSFFTRWYEAREITHQQFIYMLNELIERGVGKANIKRFFQIKRKARKAVKRKELLPNGYLAGWGKTRSIILTDGLLNNFTPTEIRVVLAHELGHHVHHDLSKKQILAFFLLAGEFFAWNLVYHWYLSFPNTQDIRLLEQGYDWLLLMLGIRLGSYLLKRAYSRRNEWQADEFALQLTGDVRTFKTTMIRLMNTNHNPYTLSPGMEIEQRHPSTRRRIQHADEFAIRLAQARRVT